MQFKNKLSPQISKAIKANTTLLERESVAAIYGLSIHTFNSVLNMQRNVSDSTKNCMIDIIEVAIDNANARGEALTDCLVELSGLSGLDKIKLLVMDGKEVEDIGWENEEFISLVVDRSPFLPDHLAPYYMIRIHRLDLFDYIENEELNICVSEVVDINGVYTTDEWAMDVEEVAVTEDLIRSYILDADELKYKRIEPSINN